ELFAAARDNLGICRVFECVCSRCSRVQSRGYIPLELRELRRVQATTNMRSLSIAFRIAFALAISATSSAANPQRSSEPHWAFRPVVRPHVPEVPGRAA